MQKTIAIIPARGGSKRLPGKNIIDFGGIPLLAHSIRYAQAHSEIIDAVYVSTDDADIKKIALQYGALVLDRPKSISGDHEPTVTALQHALEALPEAETVVLLQPTNPLRPAKMLEKAFAKFRSSGANSLFTVTENRQKFGKISDNRYIPFNYEIGQRSQDLEPLFFENGLLYICTRALVLSGKIVSESVVPMVIEHPFATVDIDTKQDLDYAIYLLKDLLPHEL